jgi:large subunit ribosomal protein L23
MIIVRPHITEKTMRLAQGDPRERDLKKVKRSYTFVVAPTANKIEIKAAVEAIFNAGRKDNERIEVASVRTVTMHGKRGRRVGNRQSGYKPDWKKAVVTLSEGQIIEEYGV